MFDRNKEMSNIPLFQVSTTDLLMSDSHQMRNYSLLCVSGQCSKLGGLLFWFCF